MNIIPVEPPIFTAYRGFLKLASFQLALFDEVAIRLAGLGPIPPAYLRARVHGGADLQDFLNVGRRCAQDLEGALQLAGRSFATATDILDFGCGSGRTLLWLRQLGARGRICGTDIDAEAIDWCARHLSWGQFGANAAKPPLRYADGQFDVVYAISVFTHLDEVYQFEWLRELQRVTRPGGIVLVTLHGRELWKHFPPAQVRAIEAHGIQILQASYWRGIFPEWYQNTYHTRDYVDRHFSRYFDVLHYLSLGLNNNQDIVVLRRRDEPVAPLPSAPTA